MANSKKSSLSSELGAMGKQAFEEHKGDETKYDTGSRLPAGIENGVAQLTMMKFDKYKDGDNKGKWYFYAAGTVIEPKLHNGAPCSGLQTSIMEPLCETPNKSRKTVSDHLSRILNELRLFDVETKSLGFDDLEPVTTILVQRAPYFRFRTWKGDPTKEFPNPRVNEVWGGVKGLEEYVPPSASDEVNDQSGDFEGVPSEEASGPPNSPPPSNTTQSSGDPDDLDSLAAKGDGNDPSAQKRLLELALSEGIEKDVAEATDSWQQLADMVKLQRNSNANSASSAAEPEAEADELVPEKSQVLFYTAAEGDTPVEVEVTSVSAAKKICNVKSMADGTIFKGVKWSQLKEAA